MRYLLALILLSMTSCHKQDAPSAPKLEACTLNNKVVYTRAEEIVGCRGDSGVIIESGTDTNADKLLESFEICQSTFLCDGEAGPIGVPGEDGESIIGEPGKNGEDGVGIPGQDGHTSLINFSRADSIPDCSDDSGSLLIGGVDVNHSGFLDGAEVTTTSFVCDGSDAQLPQQSITASFDPCGDNPGQYDEVLLKTSGGTYIAYFEQGGNRFLSILGPGSYRTTDTQQCYFSIDAQGIIR
jgi:hypothetical protein